ncbi:autoinducer synthase [Erwinia amylovora]|uniref:autoinducer synthase n=1 Tax=Erwinia amylovora TaxID=552 RepID=UPI001443FF48|nr:autoinducer synthase [Erwinia amylovora]
MKIIQTKLRDMPSSLLAELGSYRYNVFVKSEGWAIPSRLSSPGQEYDRYDCSDVICLIAWTAQYGICGYARLLAGSSGLKAGVTPGTAENDTVWEMSRLSARLEIDAELPLNILRHATQLAEQSGIHFLYSAATPMLEKMFDQHQINYQSLMPEVVQSEDNPFAIKIPVNQPFLAAKFCGARRFSPEEVLPTFGVSANFGLRGRHKD